MAATAPEEWPTRMVFASAPSFFMNGNQYFARAKTASGNRRKTTFTPSIFASFFATGGNQFSLGQELPFPCIRIILIFLFFIKYKYFTLLCHSLQELYTFHILITKHSRSCEAKTFASHPRRRESRKLVMRTGFPFSRE